jgi:O-antigen ligase
VARFATTPILTGDVPGGVSGFQRFGYLFLLVYLFLIYSRIFDVKMSFLHIPGISYRIILAVVFLSGALLTPLQSGIGRCMGFMTLWFVLAIPTSLWRRGSLEIAAGVMFLMLIMVSKTGSRGALIAFAALVLTVFLRPTLMEKLKLIFVGCLILGTVISLMPGKLLRRYRTFPGSDNEEIVVRRNSDYDPDLEASATSSTESRRELLRNSIKFTLQHPLFGVGPGMFFTMAEDADAKFNGKRKGTWQGTHNSYTQVSSELGIPGALACVAVIFLSVRKSAALTKTNGRAATRGSRTSVIAPWA